MKVPEEFKEFNELQKQFEKDITKIIYGHTIERASGDVPKNEFYNDGTVNDLFLAYMTGYAYGKRVTPV